MTVPKAVGGRKPVSRQEKVFSLSWHCRHTLCCIGKRVMKPVEQTLSAEEGSYRDGGPAECVASTASVSESTSCSFTSYPHSAAT